LNNPDCNYRGKTLKYILFISLKKIRQVQKQVLKISVGPKELLNVV